MKKHLLYLLIPLSIFSQPVTDYQQHINRPYADNGGEDWVRQLNPNKKVKSVSWEGNRVFDRSYYELDTNGHLKEMDHSFMVYSFPLMKRVREIKKMYYSKNLVTRIEFYTPENKLKGLQEFEYFTPEKIKNVKYYFKGDLISENRSRYNADSSIAEFTSLTFKKGKAHLRNRYEYEYHAHKQRKQTRMYNSNNKLIHVWEYECDSRGNLKARQIHQICRQTTQDALGRTTEVIFSTDQKGKKTKRVTLQYEAKGRTIIVSSEFYVIEKNRERKINYTHFPDSAEKWYIRLNYDRKGRVASSFRDDYSNYGGKNNIRLKSEIDFYSGKKKILKKTVQYNDKGLFQSCITEGTKGHSLGRIEYFYQGDSLITLKHIGKKGKLKKETMCRVKYF